MAGAEATVFRSSGWSTGRGSFLRQADLWLRVPVDILMMGSSVEVYDEDAGYLADKDQPAAISGMAIGLQAGVQLRFLGHVTQREPMDEGDEPDGW